MPDPTSPLQESDLIFSNAASGWHDILGELKRSNLSISNRLRSIYDDAKFVKSVAEALKLPLIANERCGSWYIPPVLKAGSAYFKSTDGHHGQWAFSLRRLNLQVLDIIGAHDGCIIVDSTRRGKSMPDALSKTVPIWVTVLNRVLFPERTDAHALRTPPEVVSNSEHAQIDEQLPAFAADLRSLTLDTASLRSKLCNKPLQVQWLTPAQRPDADAGSANKNYHQIVLCTASSSASSADPYVVASPDYVQGAADDSESWALGLDAVSFWAHAAELLKTPGDDLPVVIGDLVSGQDKTIHIINPKLVKPTRNIFIANNASARQHHHAFDLLISCAAADKLIAGSSNGKYIQLVCRAGKLGSRDLRAQLSRLQFISMLAKPDSKILISCDTGKDLAVGVALAIICRLCNEHGDFDPGHELVSIGKTLIKHRLSWIMLSMPDAAPSRATLQSVNAYLMG
ncbi:hypothetical protein BAUCODRAFT_68731 [Baudoinia panamericana UAMH 10762]|uniref:Initiator tRNA phosphoribosyl transferase n=1 Tax=Baudoinia panamericana (strain UAMH 10762) TaxID=717646 RepID=M2MJZ2_BAUPA|nr:uncharacterized protein BAUCODRAFT_68731 [Baudoinia panamericana UAMH 10762]EMC97001.1 hypothetical protein BAUCODRAFT_68731 [Baudoinia panamericana UAMH 10762]